MYKREAKRYIPAGENELYRYGKEAQEKVRKHLKPNEAGFYTIKADGGKYWTFGTSEGERGEYARVYGVYFPVNSAGCLWARADKPQGEMFVKMINQMLKDMEKISRAHRKKKQED